MGSHLQIPTFVEARNLVPDLPGCVTCGDTLDEVRSLIGEAVAAHIESLRRHGEHVPPPTAKSFGVKAA